MTQAPPEPHAGRTALEVATAARVTQLAVRARLMRDVSTLWPMLDRKRLDETWPGWLRAMSLLIRNYHGQSAQAAAAAYRTAREQATLSPAPRSLIHLAPLPPQEWLDKALGYSGPGMFQRDIARPNTALSTTLGTATRIALDGGRSTTLTTVRHDPVALGWYRVTDGDPCAFCALLASRPALKHEDGSLRKGALYQKDSFEQSNARFDGPGEFKVHNNCVLPGTLTTGPAVQTGYRRRYEGEVITLVTAAGNELSITPNHPVLTDRGWVLASMLNEGDNLVRALGSDWALRDGPDVNHVPTRIEDVVGALSMDGSASRLRVPVTAEQFHGDGFASEVDVVTLHDLLWDVVDSPLLEPDPQLDLVGASAPCSFGGAPCPGLSEEHLLGVGLGAPSGGGMGGAGSLRTLFGGQALHRYGAGLAGGTGSQAALLEPSTYDASGHAVSARKGQDAFAGLIAISEVPGDDVFGPRVNVRRKFDPPAFDRDPETLRVFAQMGADLSERLAGSVQLDRLVDKRSWQYHGDVLNLETVEGWYNANGITVSNCGCSLAPMFSANQELPDIAQQAAEVYRDRGEGDALAAFRKAWNDRNSAAQPTS